MIIIVKKNNNVVIIIITTAHAAIKTQYITVNIITTIAA